MERSIAIMAGSIPFIRPLVKPTLHFLGGLSRYRGQKIYQQTHELLPVVDSEGLHMGGVLFEGHGSEETIGNLQPAHIV